MSKVDCSTCGGTIYDDGCACGATWPSTARVYGWLATGLLLLPVSLVAAYGTWILAGRTVFERPSLGPEGVVTGAVLVGLLSMVALAGPAITWRGFGLLRTRHHARIGPSPSTSTRFIDGVAALAERIGSVPARVPNTIATGIIAAGVFLWVVANVVGGHLTRPAFVGVTALGWIAVPFGIVLDSRGPTTRRWYAMVSLVPFVAAVGGVGYLVARFEQ